MGLTFRTGSGGKGSALTIDELDNNFRYFTSSYEISGSISGSFSGSFEGDGSGLTGVISASYAESASVEIIKEVSSSYADVAGGLTEQPSIYVTNITSSGEISGSGDIIGADFYTKEYLYHVDDNDTYLRYAPNLVNLVAGGTSAIRLDKSTSKIQINNSNADLDTQIMGEGGDVLFHVDASGHSIGIGTSAPPDSGSATLTVSGSISGSAELIISDVSASGTVTAEHFYSSDDAQVIGTVNSGYGIIGYSLVVNNNGHGGGDFRVESATNQYMLYSDANQEAISIGAIASAGGSTLGVTGDITSTSHITASGNISASGDITTEKLILEGDGNTYIETHSSDAIRAVVNSRQMLALDEDTGNRAVFGSDTKVGINIGNGNTPTAFLEVDGDIWASGSDGHITASGNINASGTGSFSSLQIDGASVDFTNLPTSDPTVAGRLWNDSNTVKISAG